MGEFVMIGAKGVVQLSERTKLSSGLVNGRAEEALPVSSTRPMVDGKECSKAKNY